MAFIVTSKNRAKPPASEGRFYTSRHSNSADTLAPVEVAKSEKELADHRAWKSKSEDERTRISLDSLKRDFVEDAKKKGAEVKDHGALDSFFAKVAEHKDRTS